MKPFFEKPYAGRPKRNETCLISSALKSAGVTRCRDASEISSLSYQSSEIKTLVLNSKVKNA